MKKQLKFYSILFLACSVLVPYVHTQVPVQARKVTVYAEKGWQDSGIKLSQGQYYSIHASGAWVSGYNQALLGPEGNGTGTITTGALLGWISKERPKKLDYNSYKKEVISQIIFIGRGGFLKASENGTLWFAMGDWSGCKECDGEIEVLITVFY